MSQKSFGVRQLNILGSGSPIITSPNDLTINANTVAITTNMTVGGNINISGVITATQFYGTLTGSVDNAINLTGGYANASSLNVSGIATVSQGRIQADASSNIRFGNLPVGSGSAGKNIAFGDQVLSSLNGGQGRNIGIGELVFNSTTSGQYNIGIGVRAGQQVSTGSSNVIIGGYDGNSGNLDIRTSSNNVVIADGQGNIRQYINSSGNVGIKTTVITEALTVAGIVSASGFYGSLNAEQLTGTLPVLDGSNLFGVVSTGSGVEIRDDGSVVGTAATIDFGTNLNVSFSSGIATITNSIIGINTSGTSRFNQLNVSGVSTFTNDVIFSGTLKSVNNLFVGNSGYYIREDLSGNIEYYFGSAGKTITHSVPTGSEFIFRNPSKSAGSNEIAFFNEGGSVELYFNASKKFETTNTGVTVSGIISASSASISGNVTATAFVGSGSSLTNLPAGQLTGNLPAIDGSALLNVNATGEGIVVEDDGSNIGSAKTVNFGPGLDVSYSASGIATITASGGSLQSRTTVSGATTSITNNSSANVQITGFKSYALLRVGLSTAGWLRIYTDSTSRSNDAYRSIGEDPLPGSGVIAEVVTTGISTTQIISPFVMGGNLDNPTDTTIYATITNLSGSTQSISANLTILQLEA